MGILEHSGVIPHATGNLCVSPCLRQMGADHLQNLIRCDRLTQAHSWHRHPLKHKSRNLRSWRILLELGLKLRRFKAVFERNLDNGQRSASVSGPRKFDETAHREPVEIIHANSGLSSGHISLSSIATDIS